MGHGAVGTEHLVLALTGVDAGIVAEVFAKLGITADTVREQVRTRLGPGPDRAAGGHVPFSPLAKRALELSLRESLSCGDQNIRPEHLVLAVSGMGESGGSQILRARWCGSGPDRNRGGGACSCSDGGPASRFSSPRACRTLPIRPPRRAWRGLIGCCRCS